MTAPSFSAAIDVGSASLVLSGELDESGVDEFTSALELLLLCGMSRITVDMRDLTFIGSAGIGCLVRAWQRSAHLVLANVRPPQRRLLEITRLIDVFDVVDENVPELTP